MRTKKSIREAEEQGANACLTGIPSSKNPLAGREAMAWDRGWKRTQRERMCVNRALEKMIRKPGGI